MFRNSYSRSTAMIAAGLLVIGCADTTADPTGVVEASRSLNAAVIRGAAIVNWHPQQGINGKTGPVAGAEANLVRQANGASFRLQTTGLIPGNAYTLWLVVVNNPEACANTPCSGPDLFTSAVHSQVRFAAGHVAGGSGRGTFAGSVAEGPMSGWLEDRSFEDAMTAEIHLVINDHGPALSEHMPGMIRTYRGGCADRPVSPFPPFFPQTALDDGLPGPNVCRLFQAAIFQAP